MLLLVGIKAERFSVYGASFHEISTKGSAPGFPWGLRLDSRYRLALLCSVHPIFFYMNADIHLRVGMILVSFQVHLM